MEAELYSDTKPLKKLLLDNHKCEIMNKASNENEEKSANNEALIINKKPNKPMTPYIAFVKEFKENHGGASFKELGRIWNEITSVEEKQKYVKIAEEDMNRYRKEMAAYLEFVTQNPQNNEEKENNEEIEVAFPLTRIKNMLKCDEDNKLIKKNVLLYIEQATELFGEYLLKDIIENLKEKKNKKKKLETSDLFEIIKKNKKLTFLRSTGIVEAPITKPIISKIKDKSEKPNENSQKKPVTNNKKISDYFKKI